jgi:hypothetical protein
MASFEGSIGTPSGAFNLKVEYSYSQSVSGNYSDVTATGYVKRNRSSVSPYNSSSSSSLVINGTSKGYSGSYDLRSDGYKTIISNTVRVSHNNDGTKSITISFSFNGKLSSYYPNGSISQTITLPTIPRKATVSAGTDFNDEGNPKITFSNPGGFSLMPYLNFYLNGSVVLNLTRSKGSYSSPYTWSLTNAERTQIRTALKNVNSCQLTEGVDTYNGSTKLGYSSVTKTVSIVNANPTFSNFEFEDVNPITLALTGNNQNVIRGYSNIKATIPVEYIATANKEATMKKYSFVCSDAQRDITYSSSESTNNTIEGVKAGVFNVYAIDSRNNSTLVTKNANETIDYNPLIKNQITIARQNGTSEYTTLNFNGKADLINFGLATNSIQEAKYRYKITDSSTWSNYTDLTLTIDQDGNFSFNDLIQGDTAEGFDIEHSYNIEVLIADELSTIIYTANLNSGIPGLAIHKNGVSVMGKYDVEEGGLLQIAGKDILNTKFVYDNTLTSNVSQITIPCDIIKDGGAYELCIIGNATSETDLGFTLNNITTGYFQTAQGQNYTNLNSSSDATGTYVAGFRPNKSSWYYGCALNPNYITIIKFNLYLDSTVGSSKRNKPFAEGRAVSCQVPHSYNFDLAMQQSQTFDNITSINIKTITTSVSIESGTRITLKKI